MKEKNFKQKGTILNDIHNVKYHTKFYMYPLINIKHIIRGELNYHKIKISLRDRYLLKL